MPQNMTRIIKKHVDKRVEAYMAEGSNPSFCAKSKMPILRKQRRIGIFFYYRELYNIAKIAEI